MYNTWCRIQYGFFHFLAAYISPDTLVLRENGNLSFKAIPEDKPLEVIFMAPELQQKGKLSDKVALTLEIAVRTSQWCNFMDFIDSFHPWINILSKLWHIVFIYNTCKQINKISTQRTFKNINNSQTSIVPNNFKWLTASKAVNWFRQFDIAKPKDVLMASVNLDLQITHVNFKNEIRWECKFFYMFIYL